MKLVAAFNCSLGCKASKSAEVSPVPQIPVDRKNGMHVSGSCVGSLDGICEKIF